MRGSPKRGKLGGGNRRHDLLRTCPACQRKLRPCNLLRHMEAQHPDAPATEVLRDERDTRTLRWAITRGR